jgi:hypothetical protein
MTYRIKEVLTGPPPPLDGASSVQQVSRTLPMQQETWWSTLARHGARFVDEALRDHPDGPVVMVTTRYATEIDYRVVVGDPSDGDRGRARVVWDRSVSFGATDARVAGGSDFVAATRAQDEVAFMMYALPGAAGGTDDVASDEEVTRG